ncbi:hypothetical protein GJV03_20785 [Acinetobacter sp. RIT698]|uniref:HNH endonuclease n=1 Tax=Acinetobacter sp. RIT698 TaxID=2666192 RepID=UPI0012ACFEC2|nr:HNH endonuclease [Acinetobacter sp. RIT698]MRT39600.1 hypothetical protein [Acinetobacter sp. RIT698]
MIKLERPAIEPIILIEKAEECTKNLMHLIKKYGSYSKIPIKQKNSAISLYKHEEIKNILFPSSFKKCAFCETFPEDSGNIEVEHFLPKAQYPEKIFDWKNLLPSCRKCNGNKGEHDTVKEPIVNPYEMDPKDFFEVDFLKIKAKNEIAKTTLKACGLNSVRLYRPRSDICKEFSFFEDELETHIEEFKILKTKIKKKNKLKKINESIDVIEALRASDSAHSFFCNFLIERSEPFNIAKKIVEEY